jgi:hypothetical protein
VLAQMTRSELFVSGTFFGFFVAIIVYVIIMALQDAKAKRHKKYMTVSKNTVLRMTQNKIGEDGTEESYYPSTITDPLLKTTYTSTNREFIEPNDEHDSLL